MATFADSTARPGVSFEYAVTAFDATDPPNESERCAARTVLLRGGP